MLRSKFFSFLMTLAVSASLEAATSSVEMILKPHSRLFKMCAAQPMSQESFEASLRVNQTLSLPLCQTPEQQAVVEAEITVPSTRIFAPCGNTPSPEYVKVIVEEKEVSDPVVEIISKSEDLPVEKAQAVAEKLEELNAQATLPAEAKTEDNTTVDQPTIKVVSSTEEIKAPVVEKKSSTELPEKTKVKSPVAEPVVKTWSSPQTSNCPVPKSPIPEKKCGTLQIDATESSKVCEPCQTPCQVPCQPSCQQFQPFIPSKEFVTSQPVFVPSQAIPAPVPVCPYDESYTSICDPCGSSCFDALRGFGVYADYLYWKARRGDLDYAVNAINLDGPFTGNVYALNPEYSSGYRVGITKECNCFYLDGCYTHYNSHVSKTTIVPPPGLLAPTHGLANISGVNIGQVQFARSEWKIDYDTGDVLAGYNWNVWDDIDVSFFGGFKIARIYQRVERQYFEAASSPVGDQQIQNYTVNGYGADFGLGVDYSIWNGLELFGSFSCDLLLAHLNREYIYQRVVTPGNIETGADVTDISWRLTPVINAAFGIGYNYPFFNRWLSNIRLSVGYEFHSWLNLPDFLEMQAVEDQVGFQRTLQSLGFDGLFVRLGLDF
jgi:hypothetical protein